jgi:Skp family chaperone for outer membrane proteins
MAKRYEVLVEEINKLVNSPVVDQKTIQAKREEAEKLQRDYKYEEEDYKVVAGRRSNEVLGPIRKEIYDALVVFSNQRGITMLFDVGGENPPPIIFAIPSIDITKAFIVEFNAKNPGTAASTTTPGTTPTRP